MTSYAKNLIQYVMDWSHKSHDEAVEYLDEFASPGWRQKNTRIQNDGV